MRCSFLPQPAHLRGLGLTCLAIPGPCIAVILLAAAAPALAQATFPGEETYKHGTVKAVLAVDRLDVDGVGTVRLLGVSFINDEPTCVEPEVVKSLQGVVGQAVVLVPDKEAERLNIKTDGWYARLPNGQYVNELALLTGCARLAFEPFTLEKDNILSRAWMTAQMANRGRYRQHVDKTGGTLGEALENLREYVQNQNVDNPGGGGGQFGPAIQFDTEGVEFGPWVQRFVTQIRRNWFIPFAAMSMRGHVVVQFNVHKDGRLTDLTVVAPSDVEAFNTSAYNALLNSNPTQPLPPEYPSDRAFFTVTFYFNEQPPK